MLLLLDLQELSSISSKTWSYSPYRSRHFCVCKYRRRGSLSLRECLASAHCKCSCSISTRRADERLTASHSSCITSMIRIKYLVTFSRTYDTTCVFPFNIESAIVHEANISSSLAGDNVDVAIWSLVEVFSAIICGSIPPCRPLFTKLFRSLQSSGTRERFFCTTCNTRTCKSPDRVNEQPSEPSDSNVHLVHMNTSKELENGKR